MPRRGAAIVVPVAAIDAIVRPRVPRRVVRLVEAVAKWRPRPLRLPRKQRLLHRLRLRRLPLLPSQRRVAKTLERAAASTRRGFVRDPLTTAAFSLAGQTL